MPRIISFYPGPSRVYDEIPVYVKEAHEKGILSLNHRSPEFEAIMEKTVRLLKKKMAIPDSYSVVFTSSATECWEIIAQSLIREKSLHIFNGAFGEKWFEYTKKLKPGIHNHRFDKNENLLPDDVKDSHAEVIGITHNETSNGTFVDTSIIGKIKKQNPGSIVAVDATSSMAGVYLDFTAADIWFASVQKCFGLPAGLGIMLCSPNAVEKMKEVNESRHYNSFLFMHSMMQKWQTSFTPNVLGIYLLMRTLKKGSSIRETDIKTNKRFKQWIATIDEMRRFRRYIQNPEVMSKTVITLTGREDDITSVKLICRQNGLLLGEGYGQLNKTTFRIANFPAIKKSEIKKIRKLLRNF